jgi:hypothetical protein
MQVFSNIQRIITGTTASIVNKGIVDGNTGNSYMTNANKRLSTTIRDGTFYLDTPWHYQQISGAEADT